MRWGVGWGVGREPFPRCWPWQTLQALSLPFVDVRGLSLGEVSSLLGSGWPGVREGVEQQAAVSEQSMITAIPFLVLRRTQRMRWDRGYCYCVH